MSAAVWEPAKPVPSCQRQRAPFFLISLETDISQWAGSVSRTAPVRASSNTGGAEALLWWAQNTVAEDVPEWAEFDQYADAPMTEAKADMIESSKSDWQVELEDIVSDPHVKVVSRNDLRDYMKSRGHKVTVHKIGAYLTDDLGFQVYDTSRSDGRHSVDFSWRFTQSSTVKRNTYSSMIYVRDYDGGLTAENIGRLIAGRQFWVDPNGKLYGLCDNQFRNEDWWKEGGREAVITDLRTTNGTDPNGVI
jgi:hypothetical protein